MELTENTRKILKLEEGLKLLGQYDFPLEVLRIPGVCVRVMKIPATALLTGKIHNGPGVAILAKGRIRIADAEGAYTIEAPFVGIDLPGMKRAGYAETDCVFITVHRVEDDTMTDEELERSLVSETFEEFEQIAHERQRKLT